MSKWDAIDLDSREVEFTGAYPKFGQVEILPGRYFLSSAGIEEYNPEYHSWGMEGIKFNIYPVLAQGDEVRPMFQGRKGKSSYGFVRVTQKWAEKLTGKRGKEAFKALDMKYVRIENVRTGRNKIKGSEFLDDNNNPIPEPETAVAIVAVFEDSDACNDACLIYRGQEASDSEEPTAVQPKADPKLEGALAVVTALHGAGQGVEQIEAALGAYGIGIDHPAVKAILES